MLFWYACTMKRFVLALTGPTGAGKTTLAEKLSKQLPRCVNIDADYIKHMVPSGFSLELYDDGTENWKYNEWELVGENIGLLAANFQDNDFDVIINGYIDKSSWKEIEKHIRITHKVLLIPDLAVNHARNSQRAENNQMHQNDVERHHKYFSSDIMFEDFVKIDSSSQSVEETEQQIQAILQA